MTEKGTTFQWIFTLKSKNKQLKNVCLLSETGVQQQFKIDVIEEKELNERELRMLNCLPRHSRNNPHREAIRQSRNNPSMLTRQTKSFAGSFPFDQTD